MDGNVIIANDTVVKLADAIRAKTGKTNTMTIPDMPDEIASIQDGLVPSGNINLNSLGQEDVTQYKYATVVEPNLTAENVAEGVSILGVVGTLKSGGSGGSSSYSDDSYILVTSDGTMKLGLPTSVSSLTTNLDVLFGAVYGASLPYVTYVGPGVFAYITEYTYQSGKTSIVITLSGISTPTSIGEGAFTCEDSTGMMSSWPEGWLTLNLPLLSVAEVQTYAYTMGLPYNTTVVCSDGTYTVNDTKESVEVEEKV